MSSSNYIITIEQSATYELVLTWQDDNGVPINLTGYTALMHIRAKKEDTVILITASTANTKIVIAPLTGVITITIAAAETALITWSDAVFDLLLTSPTGFVTRLIEGKVLVSYSVTR